MEKTSILGKIVDNAPLALVLLGVAAFVLGAVGGIKTDKIELPTIDPTGKTALMGLGAILVGLGGTLLWIARHTNISMRNLQKDYGFRIESPAQGYRVTSPIEVRGSFRIEPPDGLARLLEFIPANNTYHPKPKLVIDSTTKTWSVKFGFGGSAGDQRVFVVALCGASGDALFEYYRLAGKESGRWVGIPFLPADVVRKAQVAVEIDRPQIK